MGPFVVYIRQQFNGDELQSTTLQSLGLAASSARLQLRLQNNITADEGDSHPESGSGDVWLEEKSNRADAKDTETLPVAADEAATKTDCASGGTVKSIAETTSLAARSENVLSADGMGNASQETGIGKKISGDDISTKRSRQVLSDERFRASLDSLIKSNFDAASRPVVVTATKYLDNLIKKPNDLKFRAINTANKIFQDNIAATEGGVTVIKAMGFIASPPQYLTEVVALRASAGQKLFFAFENIVNSDGSGIADDNTVHMDTLLRMRKHLSEVMEELNVPVQDRPATPTPFTSSSIVTTVTPVQPTISFDPFKPFIVRTSNQVATY